MQKLEKSGHYWAPTPQRREPTPRRRPMPRCGIPRRDEAEVPKWHPSGTPRRTFLRCGIATVHSEQFLDFVYEHLVFIYQLFRDPNKGLMGVHIRVYERENVPYLTAEAKRYSFSTINYSTTKSGEFVFD